MFKGGFGGFGGANMQQLMKQAQKMQEQMAEQSKKAEEQLENSNFIATSGGGMVSAEVSGKKKLLAIKIKPEAVDPDDVEMLEDMIVACVNEALAKAEELEKELKPNNPLGM